MVTLDFQKNTFQTKTEGAKILCTLTVHSRSYVGHTQKIETERKNEHIKSVKNGTTHEL